VPQIVSGSVEVTAAVKTLRVTGAVICALKGRVERIFFFASFKLPLFNEYEMVLIIA